MKNKPKQYQKTSLTPAKQRFAELVAQTDNATTAALQAFPEVKSRAVASVKGHRLLRNDNVIEEIEYQRAKLEKLATKAVNRVEQLIDSENEAIATTNSWKTIEQVQGKATQRTEVKTTGITLNIDLTSALEATDYPTPG